jgi:hypothetical protein
MRQRPWHMEGIGKTHFPITTKVPEEQEWFDQGNTLLHSFWFEEAERSFRWTLKLDPDCAMAYWGLARKGLTLYTAFTGPVEEREKQLVRGLQQLSLKHPQDIEAKSVFALFSIWLGNALGTELVLQQVFAKEPDHPGAHHYQIHNWDGVATVKQMNAKP